MEAEVSNFSSRITENKYESKIIEKITMLFLRQICIHYEKISNYPLCEYNFSCVRLVLSIQQFTRRLITFSSLTFRD